MRISILLLAGSAWAMGPAAAQAPQVPADNPAIRAALGALRTANAWTLEQQVSICEIPAPPFGEARRGGELADRFKALGLVNVRVDSVGNVIGERPGGGRSPRVVVSAHLDTVFPESTDVRVRREGSRFSGPGIGDDCRGLAVLLAVARGLRDTTIATTGDIVFVGTVGEEGPGNLRGVRHLFERQSAGRVDYFISVDGTGLGLTSRAVGSHRYRVTIKGPGGHSYGDFGMPNPIHALGRAIAAIGDFTVPAAPRTTFSVGIITGGTSVNSIAMNGAMDVDLRSESQVALDSLDAALRRAVAGAVEAEHARWPRSAARLTAEWAEIGKRPAGAQPDSAPIVRTALASAQALGFAPRTSASSTDANIPMSLRIPAITMDGGGRGDGAHSLGEWYDDGEDGWKGPQWVLLTVVALAGVVRK
jgi:acetylornithine deacetylase/succinyl-diaminopimelate desuccinylase-like protein